MALVFLVVIIALAAGGLIVVMLTIARDVPVDDDAEPARSDSPAPMDTTARTQKPTRRSVWYGIRRAWESWRHRHDMP